MRRLFGGRGTALFLLPFILASLMGPRSGSAQEEHRLGGGDVAVYNLAGAVEVVPGSGRDVVVQVMRGGSDASRLDVVLGEVNGHEALIINFPAEKVVYPAMGRSQTRMRVRDDGTFFGEGRSSANREVEITGSGSGLEAWADLRIAVPEGTEFALFLAVGETNVRDVEGELLIDTGSGAVYTRGGAGELNIDTGSGEVIVQDFEGDLTVDTGSGNVELNGVTGDEVLVDTGSGGVTGSGISAASLEIDTGSGDIELRAVASPDVYLDTGSGGVEVELLEDVDRLEVDTGSGGVTVRVPGSMGAQVELDSGGGGIDVDVPLEISRARRNHVEGVLGDGRGTITIDTGSGGIRIISG